MIHEKAFLARYLRSISLHIMEAGMDICGEIDPVLAPTWPSLLLRLDRSEKLATMEAARELGVSHVHVQKILKSMYSAGVVTTQADSKDRRKTYYRLTKKGRDLLPKVERLNIAVLEVIDEIEKETGDELFSALLSFKKALTQKDWKTRVSAKLNPGKESNT